MGELGRGVNARTHDIRGPILASVFGSLQISSTDLILGLFLTPCARTGSRTFIRRLYCSLHSFLRMLIPRGQDIPWG